MLLVAVTHVGDLWLGTLVSRVRSPLSMNELGNESCTTGQVYTALSHAGADADTGAMDYRTFTSALGLRKLFHKGSLFERAGELGVGAHVVELQYPRKFCLGHRFVFADLIMALP